MEVVRHIIRPIYSLLNKAKVEAEIQEDSIIWTDSLIELVPVGRLLQCWNRANDRKADNSFAPNYFDVINAWKEITKQELEIKDQAAEIEREANPVLFCSDKHNHVNDRGEVEILNWTNFSETVIVPCKFCRPTAHRAARERIVTGKQELNIENVVMEMLAKPKLSIVKPAAPELSTAEIVNLREEYNELVRQIVADPTAWKNLEVVWDDGGQVFKLPHRADRTYSPEVLKRKIEEMRAA